MQGIKLEKDLYCIGDDLKNRKFVTELVLTCPYYEGLNPCLVTVMILNEMNPTTVGGKSGWHSV